MEKQRMSRESFIQLRDFIYEKCGIYLQENKTYFLEDRLQRRLEAINLSGYDEYIYFVRYDPKGADELRELFNSVTTNETSFFRDSGQLEAFRTGILPGVLEKKRGPDRVDRTIRVWSAGCSTGEEPYTLAMIMAEAGLPLNGWKVDILASDISEQVLGSAKRAVYGQYALRNTGENHLKRYFVNGGGGYGVRPEIRDMVRFANINLSDSAQMKFIRGMDVIFCRNVLIYFDDNAKRKVVGHFYDSLAEGGFLVVGFSESLFNLTRAFRPVDVNRCVIYQKVQANTVGGGVCVKMSL
ncbi:MAG: protein-glutamate O-methyltransferase CheR [Deltaproteobacteria bacterium]|nr:protein-glutamate O-methyltransferase CheR [Deltaproteobacteria bacterium]